MFRTVVWADRVFPTPKGERWRRSTNKAGRVFDRILARAAIARVDAEVPKVGILALRRAVSG